MTQYVNIWKNWDKLNILTFEYLKTNNINWSSNMAMQEFKNDFINSMEKNYKKFYLEFLTKSFYRI